METTATAQTAGETTPSRGGSGSARRLGVRLLAIAFLLGLGVCLRAILPAAEGAVLLLLFAWSALPGIVVVRRIYGAQAGSWAQSFLVGPVWGFSLTSLVLLVMWVAGIRNVPVLLLAPILAALVAIPAGRLAGSLTVPQFTRRDIVAIIIVLALVPLVVGRPYARVGELRPEGRAYRAYFIADFVWAMAVAGEVAKGDVPPKNPFLAGDAMHYYWLANLVSAIEHRETQKSLTVDQVLLCNAVLLDLAFMAFLYAFVRQFVHSPPAVAMACVAVVLCSSFEGAQQLYLVWTRHVPIEYLRDLNIDAITRWKFNSMPVDGLQRLLLYQPHHATAWALGLSGLLVLIQAREASRVRVTLLAAILLSTSLLMSSFLAVMVGAVVGIYQFVRLVWQRCWKAILLSGVAAAVPLAAALLVSNALEYVDKSGGPLVYFGLNPTARSNAMVAIFLSFGPMLIGAIAGMLVAGFRRAWHFAVLVLMIGVGFAFYFFVDVRDHQHVYVGWRAGHLLFMAFTPLVGYALQELWAGGRIRRSVTAAAALALALAGLPMAVIDIYNTQDTSNQNMGPGFRWTVILTPDELEAFRWIKAYTPPDALVQIEPFARDSETWAYIPAFAERRMVAGIPISMIPAQKYRDASERIREVFVQTDAAKAAVLARGLGIQYLYVGPAERAKYPGIDAVFGSAPQLFRPMFHNATVSIYFVEGAAVPRR